MVRQRTDDERRDRALEVLIETLGPSQTLRFLSWLRNKPRDYQVWRDAHFHGFTADELITQMPRHRKLRGGPAVRIGRSSRQITPRRANRSNFLKAR